MHTCSCCPAIAEFALTDHDEHGPLPLCERCLTTWLEMSPEDGARVQPVDDRPDLAKRALRAVCAAMKRNRELADLDRVAPGDVPAAVRTAADVTMDRLRSGLERRAF